MELITSYFHSITFTKVDFITQTNGAQYIVYAARVSQSLADGIRFIIAHVKNRDDPAVAISSSNIHPETASLDKLQWVSLQTRMLKTSPYVGLREQSWSPSRYLQDVDFMYTERNTNYTKYIPVINHNTTGRYRPPSLNSWSSIDANFPISMILLNDKKKKSMYQHHNKTTLLVALNTFMCVLTRTNNTVSDGDMQLIS